MDSQYKGMTVIERLYVSGLIANFDRAVESKDVEEIIDILKRVEIMDMSSIKSILEELGLIKKE